MSSFFRSVREALGIAPVDRFTVDYLRHLLGILERNPVVTPSNVEAMVETVRAAARPSRMEPAAVCAPGARHLEIQRRSSPAAALPRAAPPHEHAPASGAAPRAPAPSGLTPHAAAAAARLRPGAGNLGTADVGGPALFANG